jgi:two-component system response regulator DevR
MMDRQQIRAVLGAGGQVGDCAGERVGRIVNVVLSPRSHRPAWVTVACEPGRVVVVPLAAAHQLGGCVQLPYTVADVRGAPRVDGAAGRLTARRAEELGGYFDALDGHADRTAARCRPAQNAGGDTRVATGRLVSVRSELPVVRVFLVDEQEVVRRGVAKVLEGDTQLGVVGEAGSVSEALRRVSAIRPDVAVVAMPLSDGSGAHVCERLQALVPGMRCLMLGESTTDETVHAAMRAGAWGYLDKHVTGPALLAAVRRVASGETVFDREAAALSGHRGRRRVDRLALLTYRERAVLGLIGEGLSNREIGERLELAGKTVKNYVTDLLAKLGLDNRTQAAILATQLRDDLRDGESAA